MADEPGITHGAAGSSVSAKDKLLETGASLTQSFAPLSQICAHLNAFHVYASDRTRCVEANHYCTHLSSDVRQCLIYDAATPHARLIGVEYMVTPKIYATLPPEERALWHSHAYEVKSGMLVMPTPKGVPLAAWELAETKEMEEIVGLYGKTFHLWQVDRGDVVPLGMPQLMMSFTDDEGAGVAREMWGERDRRFQVDAERKREARSRIEEPVVHQDADKA